MDFDDFDEELAMRARLEAANGGDELTMLGELATIKAIHGGGVQNASRDLTPKAVSINPPTWNRGRIGNMVTLAPGPTTSIDGPQQQLIWWQGEDREVVPVSVMLAQVVPLQTNTAYALSVQLPVYPTAIVTVGTQGAYFNFNCDISVGTMFTVPCSSIAIQAYLSAPSSGSVNVTGALSFYSVSRPVPLTLTSKIASGGVNVPRPPFASCILGFTRITPGDAVTFTLFNNDGTTSAGQFVLGANVLFANPIYLPAGCGSITISGLTNFGYLVWGLF